MRKIVKGSCILFVGMIFLYSVFGIRDYDTLQNELGRIQVPEQPDQLRQCTELILIKIEKTAGNVLQQFGIQWKTAAQFIKEAFAARDFNISILSSGIDQSLLGLIDEGQREKWSCLYLLDQLEKIFHMD